MNLNQLRIFHAVVQTQNFTRAAEQLSLTQSAVSQQIQELEKEYDTALFDRIGKRIYITEIGQILSRYVEQILTLIDESHTVIREQKGMIRGKIRIGASPTIGAYILPALLTGFQVKYPDSEPSLDIQTTVHLEQRLTDNILDLALVEGNITRPELVVIPWMHDDLCLIVNPAHPWHKRTSINTSELLSERFLLYEPTSGTRHIIEERLRERNIILTHTMELGNTEALKHGVMAGLGVTILSRHALNLELANGLVHVVQIEDMPMQRLFYLAYHRDKFQSPMIATVLSFLQQQTA